MTQFDIWAFLSKIDGTIYDSDMRIVLFTFTLHTSLIKNEKVKPLLEVCINI